jgi:hypothetical protein
VDTVTTRAEAAEKAPTPTEPPGGLGVSTPWWAFWRR